MDSITAFTSEEKAAIEAQLERLLANPFFSHSRRFPSFLRYVVDKTLAGDAELLKERTLGIEIFGKGPDYDTASDPIVRVTAAEIRKRIAQYYQEPGHQQELRISLPPGSYIPQFHPAGAEPVVHEALSLTPPPQFAVPVEASEPVQSRSPAKLFVAATALLLLAAGCLILWQHEHRSAFAEFWSPILSANDPILFCVADQPGYNSIILRDAANPSHAVTLQDNVTAIVIDDLSTITKIAGVLETSGLHYSIHGENQTTLMDLRNGPSVIVGAFDNAWTLRLLQPLRFHFANNPEMTKFSIVDSSKAGATTWTIDRVQQLATNNYRDYAIVARFTDDTTGKPTLITAGIGRGGTIAAGEFVTSPDLLKLAEKQRPSGNQKNIEVVLSTQIINGEPGTPTIEAVYFW